MTLVTLVTQFTSADNRKNVSIAEIRSAISTSDPSLTFLGHPRVRERVVNIAS